MRRLLAHTWLLVRGHDYTKEPDSQRRFRMWLLRGVHAMQYNPHTQWRYHIIMSWLWLASAIPILVLFFGFPADWVRWGVFITLLYSLYANFVSDFTGVHAAWSALRGDQIHARTEDIVEAVEDVEEKVIENGRQD